MQILALSSITQYFSQCAFFIISTFKFLIGTKYALSFSQKKTFVPRIIVPLPHYVKRIRLCILQKISLFTRTSRSFANSRELKKKKKDRLYCVRRANKPVSLLDFLHLRVDRALVAATITAALHFFFFRRFTR